MSYDIKCGFCNKKDDKTINFYKTNATDNYICDNCITSLALAKDKVHQIKEPNSFITQKDNVNYQNTISSNVFNKKNIPSPSQIFDYLSKNIIGQEEAKKTISIAVAHHYRRLIDPSIGKSNILLAGPSGTGKTELARSISTYLNVPFATADATSFTSKGYIGEDIDSIVQRLLINCDWNIQQAEQGIIFIDEIDKIAKRGHTNDSSVNTTAVQQELLRILEGDRIKINKASKTSPTGFEAVYINTKNILFICAGAFVGLQEIVQKQKSKQVGLVENKLNETKLEFWGDLLQSKHLKDFGVIPELLGRLPVYAVTKHLSKEDLLTIITSPENSLSNQYKKLFSIDDIKIEFSKEFYDNIANEAIKSELGARGLRVIFEKKMKDMFFNIHNYKGKNILIQGNGDIVQSMTNH